ncbi:MAG: hypothetical protein Q4C95_12930 [Planctomycetia bacterium]|nr:hypothetical protein [Planctomycetia bacterium]
MIVAQTIVDELAIMSEQLSQIELQMKNETESKNNSFLLERQTKNVATFFYDKGYIITDLKTQEPTDFPYKFAKQLWKRPELVFKYIPPIFRDLRDRNKPEHLYPIEELSKDDVAWLLNLCKSMKEQGYINYEHIKSPPTLSVVQSSIPKDIYRFFQGGWAEAVNRFLIYRTLSQYSKTKNLSYKVFWNVCLKKSIHKRTTTAIWS